MIYAHLLRAYLVFIYVELYNVYVVFIYVVFTTTYMLVFIYHICNLEQHI